MRAKPLLTFIARRLVALALLLVVISFGVFALLEIAPGSQLQVLLGTRPSTPEVVSAVKAEYHLDKPFLVRYGYWARDAARLDFGRSTRTAEPVTSAISQRLPLTFELGLYAFLITTVLGVPLGLVAAVRKRTLVDRLIVSFSVGGVSAPAFATGIALLYVFAVRLAWFPVIGEGGPGIADRVRHLTLPALALALTAMGLVLKLSRASIILALEQDYITFARARGISRRRVLTAYALRNALVPIITASGLILGYMLAGAVLVEVTFALPGLGSLLVESVTAKDITMVQALALLVAVMVVLANLLADIAYVIVDPRIGFGRQPT